MRLSNNYKSIVAPSTYRPSSRRTQCTRTFICNASSAGKSGKGRGRRQPNKDSPHIEAALDSTAENPVIDESQPFLSALERIGGMTEQEQEEEEVQGVDAVFDKTTMHDDDDDDDDGPYQELPPRKSQEEEDEFVSELLAAAGYSDQGLPLFSPEGIDIDDDTEATSEELEGESDFLTRTSSTKNGRRRGAPPRDTRNEIPDELLPRVAIVGRPNVGKSALFNRIVGKQVAIVYDFPGVTRDRLYTRASWGNKDFMLVDTGGLMSKASALPQEQRAVAMRSLGAEGLPGAIERQAAAAVEEADVIVLVADGQTGLNDTDEEVLSWLRKAHPGKPVALAVNKCENAKKADEQVAEFWSLGAEPIAVSAISGLGTGELLDTIAKALPPPVTPDAAENTAENEFGGPISLAIVGRPNVGKSSLLNSLVGEERSIVSPIAGTTRDAVDTDIVAPDGRQFTLIDTAGVRRRASIASTKDGAEPLSVDRAFRAVRRAEVAVLVIDATEGITQQDFRLAEYIAQEGRACVIAVNKWDAIPMKTNNTLSDYEANVRAQLRPIEWANVVFTSAKTGQRVARILDAATASAVEHRRRITTATLNLVVQDATGWRSPPSAGSGKRGRVYYGTQAGIKPPTFVLFCNDPKLFGEDYRKYMERQFRENIGFPGTPLRLYWRGKAGNSE